MALFEFFFDRDVYANGKRINKGTKFEFTTPGNQKYNPSNVLKSAREKYPDFKNYITGGILKEKK